MRSRRGSNPLIPFRGLTCVPSMRLTVRSLLPVGRAVTPVEDVCRARPVFRAGQSLRNRDMRRIAICPLRSRRGSNPLIPSSGTRRFSRPVPYRSATAPRQAYRRPSRRFEAISPWMCTRRSHSDSNRGNRSHGSTVFKTAAFSRSAMTPLNAHLIRLRLRIICACQCAVNGESRDFPSSRHSARCACPGSNRDPGLITGTRTSTSRVCQFRHKRTEPNDRM